MKKFKVEIKEVLSRIIEVEAEDENEAWDRTRNAYKNEEIVLDYSDCCNSTINVIKEEN